MRYCLVAPGTSLFIDPDATASNIGYFYDSGTSFAAPLVSGAAALVWQAFPYFNNDLVRQTLLGTATDLGAAGVDATFGYGLLNVGKAVLGPARFDWGTVDVDVTTLRSTWANDISGTGGLTKRGTGTLLLSSNANSFTGETQVLGGTLQTASLQSARVSIANGASLVGAGTLGRQVDNAGTLQVNGATASITGNYTQASNGRLAVNVGDRLNVAGTATIAGDLQLLGRRDYVVNTTAYAVLQATNGLQGTFDTLSSGPAVTFLTATRSYDANTAYVSLQRMDVTAVAASLGAIGTVSMESAIRVEQAFQQVDAQQFQGNGAISGGFIRAAAALQQSPTAKAAADSLRSLSGRAHAESAAMTFDTIDLGRRALASHFDGVSQQPRLLGNWQRALGGPGEGGATTSGFATSGWMMGNDLRLVSGAVTGFAFGETRSSSLGELDGARGRDRQVQAQLYWGTRLGAAYTLGQVGLGNVNRQIERTLQLGEDRSSALQRLQRQLPQRQSGNRLSLGRCARKPDAIYGPGLRALAQRWFPRKRWRWLRLACQCKHVVAHAGAGRCAFGVSLARHPVGQLCRVAAGAEQRRFDAGRQLHRRGCLGAAAWHAAGTVGGAVRVHCRGTVGPAGPAAFRLRPAGGRARRRARAEPALQRRFLIGALPV